MKGLFPWLREVLFGVKHQVPSCVSCDGLRDIRCASGYCWKHHYESCCVRNWMTGEIVYTCREREPDGELAELRKMIQ